MPLFALGFALEADHVEAFRQCQAALEMVGQDLFEAGGGTFGAVRFEDRFIERPASRYALLEDAGHAIINIRRARIDNTGRDLGVLQDDPLDEAGVGVDFHLAFLAAGLGEVDTVAAGVLVAGLDVEGIHPGFHRCFPAAGQKDPGRFP